MTVHSGFFNSHDGDRVYDAEDFSSFYDGLIFDGVYSSVGNRFYVERGTGLHVTVDVGRGWFDRTWTFNDQKLTLAVPDPDTVFGRIDAVVLEVNKSQRKNFLKIVMGTAAETPARPALQNTDNVKQHALAYYTLAANAETVGEITNVVGTAETPLASALNLAGLPSGGSIGQVLAKASDRDGAVGWYDVDKLPFDKWYLPQGINESNVIAAYRFTGRASENDALKNVNTSNQGQIIFSKTGSNVTWNTSTGFYIPAENNAGLNNSYLYGQRSNIYSVAFRFTGGYTGTGNSGQGGVICAKNRFLLLNIAHGNSYYGHCPALTNNVDSTSDYTRASSDYRLGSATYAVNFSSASSLFINGVSKSLTRGSGTNFGWWDSGLTPTIGQTAEMTMSAWRILAVVFFNTTLTDAQHSSLASMMNAL